MARILLIEDEPDVRRGLRTLLEAEGFQIDEAADGDAGLAAARATPPDLVLLDVMMPGLDGFAVCRELRAGGARFPILILTARASELDKVLGLELGADDYVTKPFAVRELLARVRALLRRLDLAPGGGAVERIGEATVDLNRAQVTRGEAVAELFHYEMEILKLLLAHRGEVVARAEILREVWGLDELPTTRTVDFHIGNLRKKIEAEPGQPEWIQTVHGVGYRLVR